MSLIHDTRLLGAFYDRQGNEIDFVTMALSRGEDGGAYAEVAKTAHNEFEVSTVWLGWIEGHVVGTNGPLIFETAILGGAQTIIAGRYPTEAEALRGHAIVVGYVRLNFPQHALPTGAP